MALEYDSEGYVVVRVKDITDFLISNCKPNDVVYLDKDGWLCDEIKPETVQDLIKQRGLFSVDKEDGYLMINN